MRSEQFRIEHRWSEQSNTASAALAAAPASEVEASRTYALFLWSVGRCKEAVEYLQEALDRIEASPVRGRAEAAGKLGLHQLPEVRIVIESMHREL